MDTVPFGDYHLITPKSGDVVMLYHEGKVRFYDEKYSHELLNLTASDEGIVVDLNGESDRFTIKFAYDKPNIIIMEGDYDE